MTLLWTIVPMDKVFEEASKMESPLREISRQGITMMVREGEEGTGIIERIISPNPQDYLRPEWQPGSVVGLGPRQGSS